MADPIDPPRCKLHRDCAGDPTETHIYGPTPELAAKWQARWKEVTEELPPMTADQAAAISNLLDELRQGRAAQETARRIS